jgi:hypothetical protein
MSSRVRQKSPPLQPAKRSVTSNAGSGNSDLSGETVSGMGISNLCLAAAPPAARRSALLGPAVAARLVSVTLDANDGKDHDSSDRLERSELRR